MRVFITVLVLIFSLQSWTKADDIRDFQIEGMSVGDSLLDFFSEKKLIGAKKDSLFKKKKYTKIQLEKLKKLEIYDTLSMWVKVNDKKYITYSLVGYVYFKKNMQDCYNKQKEIIAELNEFFKDQGVKDDGLHTRKHSADKSGKSTITDTMFKFSNGDAVQISCMDFSKKTGWIDSLAISIDTKEYGDFLINEAWK